MKLQFSTSTLLSAVAFAGITLGGYVAVWRYVISLDSTAPRQTAFNLGATFFAVSPYWMPLLFASYALGRRKLTAALIVVFALFEVAAFGSTIWMLQLMM